MQAQIRSESMGDVEPTMQRVPRELSSPRAKLVYLYLATHGAVTETELLEGLDMKRISLYAILKTLRTNGLVAREGDRYVLE
ncbi:helix-turn-helix domain-containing protein [Halorarum halobium]|uniref:helix-turn-helix domain-containing protein n=1 Tax=Halorarum halobium TaxID=3075121 RepID=UPI0028A727EC|nr:helix-turn-helix domain-containing protein [Halobaculum sp. XH14]